ncbi:MAG: kelch repeat-containing protein, partial [Polyangiales bacterium]
GGERNTAAGSRGVFAQVEAYDPRTDSWDSLAPMPTPRHGMGAAAWDGRLYIPGGADQEAAGAVAVHEVLTP